MKSRSIQTKFCRLVFTYIKKDCCRIFREDQHPNAYDGYTGAPLFKSVVLCEIHSATPPATGRWRRLFTKKGPELITGYGEAFCSIKDRFVFAHGVLLAFSRAAKSSKHTRQEKEEMAIAVVKWLKKLYPNSVFRVTREY